MQQKVSKAEKGLNGQIKIPSDKSISHRAAMFASIANGTSVIKNFSKGADPMSSLNVCCSLGAEYEFFNDNLIIKGKGKLTAPNRNLDCGNSGTTMRLMSGILSGQNFKSVLIGDQSLSKRPMKRVIEPLSLMGAKIVSNEYKAPLEIYGQKLIGINYKSELASAQVKSCILLAGLNAAGKTTFIEPFLSRDHTERMLEFMGANINRDGCSTTVEASVLEPGTIEICGDISSAAYFIAAALIVPNSEIILKNVGLNPTRTGIIDVVTKMGADIEILDKKSVSGEDVGDVKVKYSGLKGAIIGGDLIPRLIDEIPAIAVIATQAEGTTVIKDAQDLRNKESDRIKTVVHELKKIGANIEEREDGFVIQGKTKLKGDATLDTYHDHRLAMSFYVAGLVCEKPIVINDFEWTNISFPEFTTLFENIQH